MKFLSNIRRKLLYLAFILLSGVAPAYSRDRKKKIDKSQLIKEIQTPWDILKFELEASADQHLKN